MSNPCLSCGACCAYYRVSFYWAEPVPAELTVPINAYYAAMKGTEYKPARCCALGGTIGEAVACQIYASRPTSCYDVMPSGFDGGGRDEKCDKARAAHGLPPLPCDDALN